MASVKSKPRGRRSAPAKGREKKGEPLSAEEEYALNCKVSRRIMEEAKHGTHKRRMGQYVALSKGKVVAIGADLEEVFAALRKVEPDRHRGMVFKVRDPDEVVYDL